jgi:hypothetical protein
MQPLYFVKHADGSYSEAVPQPQLSLISGSQDKLKVATEFALEMASVGDDFAEAKYARQQ